MNRESQIAALASRAKCYDGAAVCSHDPTIIQGFKDAARNLLEHRQKLLTDTEYELPKNVRRELGIT